MDSNSDQSDKQDFEVNSLRNQEDNIESSSSEEDGPSTKRFKEELDPLKIGTILEMIFSNLDVDSIKNARQVNPLWSAEGAKMLMTKCYVKIPSNLQLQEESSNSKEIEEFKAFLSHKSSDHSMIPNISIDKVGDVELWKSLGVLGPKIECLKVKYVEADWLHNLLNLLPNLKHLKFPVGISRIYEDIIKVLTSEMSATKKDRRPLTISSMSLVYGSVEKLVNMEKFANFNNIMIEDFTVIIIPLYLSPQHPDMVRIYNLLGKLLSTNRNIIKKLTLINPVFLPLFEFPRMPALTCIDLFVCPDFGQGQPCKFSSCFRFSEKFPNLVNFSFELHDRVSSDFFAHLFEQTGIAYSVKSLKCNDYFPDLDFDPLFKTFPNMEELETKCGNRSLGMFQSLWKYGANLRKLNINPVGRRWSENIFNFITGFTPETVEKIKNRTNVDRFTMEELEELRVNPSILNLNNLEHLTIRFDELLEHRDYLRERFSIVEKYTFKLMPKNPEIFLYLKDKLVGLDAINAVDEGSKGSNVAVLPSDAEMSEDEGY